VDVSVDIEVLVDDGIEVGIGITVVVLVVVALVGEGEEVGVRDPGVAIISVGDGVLVVVTIYMSLAEIVGVMVDGIVLSNNADEGLAFPGDCDFAFTRGLMVKIRIIKMIAVNWILGINKFNASTDDGSLRINYWFGDSVIHRVVISISDGTNYRD
jgi:hypothetical protein